MTARTAVARVRRPVLGIAGQVLNAATNVATVYVASLVLIPAEFGAFAVGFTAITVVLAAGRGLVGSTMSVHLPTLDSGARRELERSALGFTLVIGTAAALVLLLLERGALVWLAPWVVAALLQDAVRYIFLAAGRQGSALLLDVAWAVVQGLVIGSWALAGRDVTIEVLATAWGAGAAAGVVMFLVLTGTRPARPGPWVRTTRDIAGWFTGVAVVSQIELYLVLLLTGLLLGAADAGGLRAVQLLAYQPAMVLLGALLVIATPAMVRARSSAEALVRTRRRLTVLVSPVIVVLIGVALLREPLMRLLFPQYVAVSALVVPVALQGALVALVVPPMALLQALRWGRAVLLLQLGRLVVVVLAVLAGASVFGAEGLAWGLVVGALATLGAVGLVAGRATRGVDHAVVTV